MVLAERTEKRKRNSKEENLPVKHTTRADEKKGWEGMGWEGEGRGRKIRKEEGIRDEGERENTEKREERIKEDTKDWGC